MTFPTNEILNFWFQDLTDSSVLANERPIVSRWFQSSSEFDQQIRENFEGSYHHFKDSYADHVRNSDDKLAMILLFDQFPRNMFRGNPKMYSTDSIAVELCKNLVNSGEDRGFYYIQRSFIYMPLMHSEDLKDQELMMKLFGNLSEEAKKNNLVNHKHYQSTHEEFGFRHHEIVARFGRFPHRNKILGRESSPEEIKFLEEPNSSF